MQCVQRPNLGRRQFLTTEMILDYPGIALGQTLFGANLDFKTNYLSLADGMPRDS